MSNTDVVVFLAGMFAIVFAAAGVLAFMAYGYEKNVSCPAFGAAVDRPFKYDFAAGGCFVQARNGQWVQRGNYWNGERP